MLTAWTEQLFEDILNTMRDPILVLDSNLKILIASRAFYELFKLKPEETVSRLIYDIGNGQWDIPRLRDLLETILTQDTAFEDLEIDQDFATIGRRVMTLNASNIRRTADQEQLILLVIVDITKRRQLQDLLIESEERYRRLFETANDGILLLEKSEFKIRHANPAITEMLGYSDKECIGKELKEIGISVNMDNYKNICNRLDIDGIIHCKDILAKKKTGQVIDTDIYLVDKASLVQCNVRDITERKLAEKDREKLRAQLSNALEIARLGHWEYDVTKDLFTFNDSFYKIFRTTAEQIGGYTMSSAEYARRFVHPDDIHMVEKEIRKSIEATDSHYNRRMEHRILYADGAVGYISVRFFIIKDANGRTVKTYGVNQDITDHKTAQKEILRANRIESIALLAGGVAHDFNNILALIIGYTELALDEVGKESSIGDSLQEVYAAGKRARDLVKQILTIARQSDDKIRPIRPNEVAREVLKLIRSSIPATIEIKQNIKSDSLIMGNATQVHQILMNLCTNAAYAMEDKGGTLELTMKDVVIGAGGATQKLGLPPRDYIEIMVSDTGVGIPSEIIEHIFEPYFTTKDPGEGTGIGLALVYGIVTGYGGKISVDSTLGEGTVFTIYLPITRKRQEHHPYQPGELPSGTEKILFVDDELAIARLGAQVLEGLGYSVTTRTSSIEALELFRTKRNDFDLVVTDMTMPKMTGDELAGEITKIRPDIPVILCTGYSKKISDEIAPDIGIKAFAYKPVVKADLAKTVRKVLDAAKGKT